MTEPAQAGNSHPQPRTGTEALQRRVDQRVGDQDRRADLPEIGPDTVTGAVAAGLAGIVIEKGGVIVLNREKVIEECNRLGLFLHVLERIV